MRTALYTPSPRRLTPHKYYTRNNTNPISPNAQEPVHSVRERTPPTLYDLRQNLLSPRGYRDSSDDELDEIDTEQAPSKLKRIGTSVYHVVRNILLWIGLTCLTTNVYILSLFRKLYVWRDPFSDTGYNPEENEDMHPTPSMYTSARTEQRSVFRKITSYLTSTSHTSDVRKDHEDSITSAAPSKAAPVGWCGFLTALAFLGALCYLLHLLLVPYPVPASSTATNTPDMFKYFEEQKHFVSKVVELEAGLAALDRKTAESDDSIRLAIKGLEEEKDGLKEQLVAIATLDRQQSGSIEQLQTQHLLHADKMQEVAGTMNNLNLKYDTIKTQLYALKTAIATITTVQEQLKTDLGSTSQHQQTLSTSLDKLTENNVRVTEGQETLREEQAGLSGRVLESEKAGVLLAERVEGITKENKDWTKEQLDQLREEVLKKIPDTPDQTLLDKITEQRTLLTQHSSRLDSVEQKYSSQEPVTVPAIPPDLLERLNTLTLEMETLRASSTVPASSGSATDEQYAALETRVGELGVQVEQYAALETRIGELRVQVEKHLAESGGQFSEIFKQITQTKSQISDSSSVSQIKLETIESKLAVMTALQDRLDKMEAQHTTVDPTRDDSDKATQQEIAKLVAQLKILDNKYQEKISNLNTAIIQINSEAGSHRTTTTAAIQQHTVDIRRLETLFQADISALQTKLQEYQDSTDKKIRNIVLEALASVTNSGPDTRFFSDWLQATFLSREQFNREVKNETTVVLPSQDDLVQIVIEQIQKTHKIDLTPGSGITLADIRYIVSDALQTFNEDKTGRADFALEALGGTVLSIGCTETYYEGAPYASFMSVPLYRVPNSPNVALQPDITPGKCWAFKGRQGYMMIKLAHAVHVDGFSMEHLPKKLSLYNDMSSAPKKFVVRGLSHPHDEEPHIFGEFSYSDAGHSLQHFNVEKTSKIAYEIVEVDIVSNQGNSEYTCLYRIRVHGQAPKLS